MISCFNSSKSSCCDEIFLAKEKKGKSNYYAFWTTWFNGFDKSANSMARCQRFFETLLEVINLLGVDGFMVDGFVVWGRVIGWINDSRFLNAV